MAEATHEDYDALSESVKAEQVKQAAAEEAAKAAEAAERAAQASGGDDKKDGGKFDLAKALEAQGITVVQGDDGKAVFTVDQTIDHSARQRTLKEALDDSVLAAGADSKFAKAAEMRKAAEAESANAKEAVELLALVKQSRDTDKSEVERAEVMVEIAKLLGDKDQVTELQAAIAKAKAAESGGKSDDDKRRELTMADLPAEVRKAVEQQQAKSKSDDAKNIFKVIDNSVDEDSILGKMDKDALGVIKKLARDQVQRRVVAEGATLDHTLILEVLQELRGMSKLFGKTESDGNRQGGGVPNLGGVTGGGSGAASQLTDDQLNESVPVSSSAWADRMTEKIRRKMRQLQAAK